MTKRPKPRLQAAPAYESAVMVARDMHERIGELLEDVPAPTNDTTWTQVNEMAEVIRLLAAVLTSIKGSER